MEVLHAIIIMQVLWLDARIWAAWRWAQNLEVI